MKFLLSLCFVFVFLLTSAETQKMEYLIGYGKTDITFIEQDLGLFGFGDYSQRLDSTNGFTSRIYSRVMAIQDPVSEKTAVFLHADLGAIFQPLRDGLVEKLRAEYDPEFDGASLMMTASHTHCAASGMSHYSTYMATTPGYHPELVAFTVEQMYRSVVMALDDMQPANLEIKQGRFADEVPVAFNRSLKAYNKNPDIKRKYEKEETHLAINRGMPLLLAVDAHGNPNGFMNWFGAHPIEVLNDHDFIDGASKGYAASSAEELMENGVAIFAQSGAGDVMTCDYHNHERFDKQMQELLELPNYSHDSTHLEHSIWNGKIQANKALETAYGAKNFDVSGGIDYELIFIDMSAIKVDDDFSYGQKYAETSSPILGSSFLTGSFYYKDMDFQRFGLNMMAGFGKASFRIRSPFVSKEYRQYKKHVYRTQAPKKLVVDGVEKSYIGLRFEKYEKKGMPRFMLKKMKNLDLTVAESIRQLELGALEEHTSLPTILPLQIIRIGNIAIAGIPGEITTIAHNRLQATILETLSSDGIERVFISSYANEYAGYTTTLEEYKTQRYEGGHTLYGKHQLGAYQTEFRKLAEEMKKPKNERQLDYSIKPPVFSEEELAKRSNLAPLKLEEKKKQQKKAID